MTTESTYQTCLADLSNSSSSSSPTTEALLQCISNSFDASRTNTNDAVDAFFVELSALMRRYLEDRFELRAPELTTEEFLQAASATPDLGEAQKGFLRDFLRRADMVKFARFVPSSPEMDEALREAARFLDETRDAAMPEGGAHGRV